MSKKCIWCGGVVNPGLAGDGYYCPHCDEDLTEADVNDMTVFETITSSPEVLAPKFVYCEKTLTDGDIWYSLLLGEIGYSTEPEAIAATVEKLKEVEK
jgi:hypothetical protein